MAPRIPREGGGIGSDRDALTDHGWWTGGKDPNKDKEGNDKPKMKSSPGNTTKITKLPQLTTKQSPGNTQDMKHADIVPVALSRGLHNVQLGG